MLRQVQHLLSIQLKKVLPLLPTAVRVFENRDFLRERHFS